MHEMALSPTLGTSTFSVIPLVKTSESDHGSGPSPSTPPISSRFRRFFHSAASLASLSTLRLFRHSTIRVGQLVELLPVQTQLLLQRTTTRTQTLVKVAQTATTAMETVTATEMEMRKDRDRLKAMLLQTPVSRLSAVPMSTYALSSRALLARRS